MFTSAFRRARRDRQGSEGPRRHAPLLDREGPEGRPVPSTIPVTCIGDDVAERGTLRWAVARARAGDTILLTPALGGRWIALTNGDLVLDKALTIASAGPGPATISGGGASRIFTVTPAADVTLGRLVLTDGVSAGGGAVLNDGRLTIRNTDLVGNRAVVVGGIYNGTGTLTFRGGTLSYNQAISRGGGIYNANGRVAVRGSTLSDNRAPSGGGAAIYNAVFGSVAVKDSKFVDNATDDILGLYTDEGGNSGI
jgi:fibronectin-binding autotransporter adhesin